MTVTANTPHFDTAEILTARRELAACFRMAARLGMHEGICNHFSSVVPGYNELFLVNPYGYAFSEITASSLLICDFDGNVVAGDGVPESTAFHIHAQLHKFKPHARVAFHTHMPYATALAMVEGEPLHYAGQTATRFIGRVVVDEDYNGLALDDREGARIASAIGEADIVFMRHHGVMVLADSIAKAWDDLYYLERACEVQVLAMSTGRRLLPIDRDLARKTGEQIMSEAADAAELHLASVQRLLDRTEADYKT
ncbi:ribulose-5-phosphate 4-epimerase-like epimerase or aldolase [Hoeflea sp. IMCC20628]|uniref:aldolase n=1 Tax=Hoeflea sp. IMCC20628 TaxID=1620421 RepID=UPI00063BF419|nr:aldolase [Hoeflea sp. IMCC20628]AKI02013.1 ribulose-5-phosphate 4-epimerase-like epimerase or aldolase [Hoeflea sp. IMCC20628]